MRRTEGLAAAVTMLALVVGACSGSGSSSGPSSGSQDAAASGSPSEQATGGALPQGSERVDLDPSAFTADITHAYWPMEPGTRWTYRETDGEGGVQKVVVVVTRETKKVADGITARVVRDTVTEEGQVVEDTYDWYAQDEAGNVWYLGENTAEFENGKVSSRAGSFEAGVDGALPGVALPADPQPGATYRQEYSAGNAEDNGQVLSTQEMADVPLGHYTGMLLTKDTNTLEPNVLEYKLYAKGVGPALTLGVSGGGGREELLSMDVAPPSAGTGPLGHPNPHP